jgi:hypothetical protein
MISFAILRRLLIAVAALSMTFVAAEITAPANAAVFPSHSLVDDGD